MLQKGVSVTQEWISRVASEASWPPSSSFTQEFLFPVLGSIFALVLVVIVSKLTKKVEMIERGITVKVSEDGVAKRNHRFLALVETPWERGTTIPSVFEGACKRYEKLPFLGTRELLKREFEKDEKTGRSFEKLSLGDYTWQSFGEVMDRVRNLGAGLVAIGHQRNEKLALFAETCAEWLIAFQAAERHGFVVVTVYASLGEDALVHSLNETECTTVVLDSKQLQKLGKVASKLQTVKRVVIIDDWAKDDPRPELPAGWSVHTYGDTEAKGKGYIEAKGKESEPTPPSPNDLAVIMYTSGSTGLPKGVMMSHGNLVASAAAVPPIIPALDQTDVYLAYLPLAHVLELVAELTFTSVGTRIGYGSPLTMTDTGNKLKKGTKGDATTLKPTLMATVPGILDRIRDGVRKQIDSKSSTVKQMFELAYQRRLQAIEGSWFGAWGLEKFFWDELVFKKVRSALGGRMRGMLSGGAPLSSDTQRFMNICFGIPIGQGYGLTETCAGGAFSEWDDPSVGRVGPPLPSVYVKLVDWEEGGYRVTDKPFPRGEIVIGGGSVTLGYYKNPAKTEEVFKVDASGMRWFYSGDIGQFYKDGTLEIIDRKKDIVKLTHGEYVSLGKVEAALSTCKYVSNIMVHADSLKAYTVALIVVDAHSVEDFAKAKEIQYSSVGELCQNKDVESEVMKSLGQSAKEAKLDKFETPAKVKLLADPWTPETGLVTAAFKIKRENIRKEFASDLAKLYE